MAMPYFLIDALFTRGAFLQVDAVNTAQALFQFGWGVPAFVLIRILAPAFFARGDTATPVKVGLAVVALNLALNLVLTRYLAHVGIALSTGISAWVNVVRTVSTHAWSMPWVVTTSTGRSVSWPA